MILRFIFILVLLFLLKHIVIKINYHDYFLMSLLVLFTLFSYMFVMYESRLIIFEIVLFVTIFIYVIRKPVNLDNNLIIIDGKINFLNMFKNNYSIDNLREDLSCINDIKVRKIDCGVLKDGKLFCYFDNSYYKGFPISIIFNGMINYDGLKVINKSYKWMNEILDKRRVDFNDIFYAFYYRKSFYIIKK